MSSISTNIPKNSDYTESDSRIERWQGGALNLSQAKPAPKQLNFSSLAMQAGFKFNGCPTMPEPILESRAVYGSYSSETDNLPASRKHRLDNPIDHPILLTSPILHDLTRLTKKNRTDDGEIARLTNENKHLEAERLELRIANAKLNGGEVRHQVELDRAQQRNADLERENRALMARVSDLTDQCSANQEGIADLEEQNGYLGTITTQFRIQYKADQKTIIDLKEQNVGLTTQLSAAENLRKDEVCAVERRYLGDISRLSKENRTLKNKVLLNKNS